MPCFPPKLFVLRPLATGQHAAHEPLRTGGGAAAWTRALAKQDLFSICHCQSCTRGASSRNKPLAGGPTPPKARYSLPGILQFRGTSHCVCVEALSLAGIDRVGERARPCPLEARSVPLCVLTSLPHVCFHSPAHRAKRGVPHSRRSAGAAAAAALRCQPGGSRRWWWWRSYSAWC